MFSPKKQVLIYRKVNKFCCYLFWLGFILSHYNLISYSKWYETVTGFFLLGPAHYLLRDFFNPGTALWASGPVTRYKITFSVNLNTNIIILRDNTIYTVFFMRTKVFVKMTHLYFCCIRTVNKHFTIISNYKYYKVSDLHP